MYDKRDRVFVINESDPLQNLESKSYTLRVFPGEAQLKACMTYADPPGNPTNPANLPERINDLTLRVISPSGDIYWGNQGLADGRESTPGGTPNTVDTVECVFIDNPEVGDWSVEVQADELLQDARLETPELDADFGLVVIGGIDPSRLGCATTP